MANAFTLAIRAALKNMLPILREQSIFAKIAYAAVGPDGIQATEKFQTITVTRPKPMVASDVTPGTFTAQDIGLVSEDISVDTWKWVPWKVNDKELNEVAYDDIVKGVSFEAVRALANVIDAAFISKLIIGSFQHVVRTADCRDDLVDIGMKFRDNLVPEGGWNLILDTLGFAAMMKDGNLTAANITGNATAVQSGLPQGLYGFDNILYNQNMNGQSWTDGTGTSYVLNGAASAGATSIPVDTGSGTILAGDHVVFAGHTGRYNVVTGIAAPGTLVIYPPLREDVADTGTVTVQTTTATSLGIALKDMGAAGAFRPEKPTQAAAGQTYMEQVHDDVTGLNLTYEVRRGVKEDQHMLSTLFGVGQIFRDMVVMYDTSAP